MTKTEQAGFRDWAGLPNVLLDEIWSQLFLGDICCFRLVCKLWRSSVPPNRLECVWPSQYAQAQQDGRFPWLVFRDFLESKSRCDFCPKSQSICDLCRQSNSRYKFYNPHSRVKFNINIPELYGAIIRFAKDGWFLMSRGERSIFFFHLITKARIDLPDLPEEYCFTGVCFTSQPTSADCTVLGIFGFTEKHTWLFFIRRGEKTWKFHEHKNLEVKFLPSHTNPVFHKGAFYCLGMNSQLGVFEPGEECVSWRVLDEPEGIYDSTPLENWLVDLDGKIYMVYVKDTRSTAIRNNERPIVSVFMLDELEMTWEETTDLGDYILFVSNCTSFAAKTEVGGMKNMIYFPRFHEEGEEEDGVFYSLQTKMFHSPGGKFSSKYCANIKEHRDCSWMPPGCCKLQISESLIW